LTLPYTIGIVAPMEAGELRRLRRRAGLTQAALAARLGIKPNTVARWEQQVRSISEPMARLIRMVLQSGGARR
jgi:DNA-binding transcriptional regulator YiaG